MVNNKRKNTSSIIIVAVVLLVLIVIVVASIMTKCGDSSDSTNNTNATTDATAGMQIIGSISATDENGNTISSNENSENNPSLNANGSSQTNSGNNSGSNSNNNSSDTNNNGSNNQNANNNSNNSSTKVCNVDGNKYNVGDTVTCTFKLKSPETLVNYQGYISYDSKYLKVTKAILGKPASSGGIINYKNVKNQIVFNGSNITTGFDYTKGGTLITVTYEVVAGGSTKTAFNWQVARGFSSNKVYVNDGKADSGLVITKDYS